MASSPLNTMTTPKRQEMGGSRVRQIGGSMEDDENEILGTVQTYSNTDITPRTEGYLESNRVQIVEVKLEDGGGTVNFAQSITAENSYVTQELIDTNSGTYIEIPRDNQKALFQEFQTISETASNATGTIATVAENFLSLVGGGVPEVFDAVGGIFDHVAGKTEAVSTTTTSSTSTESHLTPQEKVKLQEVKEKFAMEIESRKHIQHEQNAVNQIDQQEEEVRLGIAGKSNEQVAKEAGFLNTCYRGVRTLATGMFIAFKTATAILHETAEKPFNMVNGRINKKKGLDMGQGELLKAGENRNHFTVAVS